MGTIISIASPRGFWKWIVELDRILRGETTSLHSIREGMLNLPVAGLAVVLTLLAAIYGVCMGFFGVFNAVDGAGPGAAQLLASMIKVPALFMLTLIVTFPSLYVFNALVGSRLTLRTLTRLMVAAMAVMLAVLASFGPIVAFFSVTTTSHPFILLLNVFFCGVAGVLGMMFLLQTLHRLTLVGVTSREALDRPDHLRPAAVSAFAPATAPIPATAGATTPPAGTSLEVTNTAGQDEITAPPPVLNETIDALAAMDDRPVEQAGRGPLDEIEGHVLGAHVKTVFRFWVIAFALVGSQMSWVLRPFIGVPGEPFTLFGDRGSNFFEAVLNALGKLLGK